MAEDSITVSFTLSNDGGRDGKAVPQLYVRDCVSSVATPVKQLKAFNKVCLKSGQKIRQYLKVAVADLGFTDENGVYKVEPGAFELMLGDASDNILLKDTITIGDATDNITEKSSAEHVVIEKNIKVQGTVRDMQATLMPGVEIYSTLLKKKVGTTNAKGEYVLNVLSNDILLFRRKGYIEEHVKVGGLSQIQVKMRYGS